MSSNREGINGPYSKIKIKTAETLSTFDSLNDWDVLCGRGNGVNNRRGNVEFRLHVDQLRPAYHAAKRQDKNVFARQVVQRVYSHGGKFLRFKGVNQVVYIEIGKGRAVEKACQALRENRENRVGKGTRRKMKDCKLKQELAKRELAKVATSSSNKIPSSGGKAKDKTSKKMKKEVTKHSIGGVANINSSLWQVDPRPSSASGGQYDVMMDDDGEGQFDDLHDSTESDSISSTTDDDNGIDTASYYSSYDQTSPQPQSHEQDVPTHRLMGQPALPIHMKDQPAPSGWFCDFMNGGTSDTTSPAFQACWENVFRSLVQFKEVHGHCAIPPSAGSPHVGSSKEERELARLADWSSVQRQVVREVQNGRRSVTGWEKARFSRLDRLGFVWNYEEWHWDKRYEELVRFQQKEKEARNRMNNMKTMPDKDHADFSKCLGLALWIKEQRQLYIQGLQGKIHQMREDRVRKLEKINFSWAADVQITREKKPIDPSMVPSVATTRAPPRGTSSSGVAPVFPVKMDPPPINLEGDAAVKHAPTAGQDVANKVTTAGIGPGGRPVTVSPETPVSKSQAKTIDLGMTSTAAVSSDADAAKQPATMDPSPTSLSAGKSETPETAANAPPTAVIAPSPATNPEVDEVAASCSLDNSSETIKGTAAMQQSTEVTASTILPEKESETTEHMKATPSVKEVPATPLPEKEPEKLELEATQQSAVASTSNDASQQLLSAPTSSS